MKTKPSTTSAITNLSLQEAFNELETITATLERGEGDLENSIPLLKRGHELAAFLTDKLSSLEQEIREVTATSTPTTKMHGQDTIEPSPAQSTTSAQNAQNTKQTHPMQNDDFQEDMLTDNDLPF